MADYDVIIVGGGIMGSTAAYYLAKQGKRTLILEQFPLPHTRGSSHGHVRILRKAYDKQHYIEMMEEAYPMWEDIEKEAKTNLMQPCQMLMYGEDGSAPLRKAEETLRKSKSRYEKLSPEELQKRFPKMNFEKCHGGLLDHDAGLQKANKVLLAVQELFTKSGGRIQAGEGVTHIEPGNVVLVTTNRGQYRCKSLILAPGPWAAKLLQPLGVDLPIKLLGLTIGFWKRKGGDEGAVSDTPLVAALRGSIAEVHPLFLYGLPTDGYPYHLKADIMDGRSMDIEAESTVQVDPESVKKMTDVVKEHFPGLEDTPSVTENGIIAMTPDADIILDCHPVWSNIIIGAGFSGHGYKLAPVIGKILGQLATGVKPDYDISALKIDRFNKELNTNAQPV